MNADRLGVGSEFVYTHQPYGREGQIKQWHSPYVSLSVFFTHTHKHTHAYGQKDGGWTVATTCLTLSRLSTTVTPARADPSLSLSLPASPFTLKKFILWCFLFWDVVWNFFFLLFLSSPSLHHGLWIWAYLSQCRMFSGSRNVDSGPPIRLVRAGRTSGVKQVSSWDWHPWNHEPKSR